MIIGKLDYSVLPPAVFVGQEVDLTLVITNPMGQPEVEFQGGNLQRAEQIVISFTTTGSNAITQNLDFGYEISQQPQPPDDAKSFALIFSTSQEYILKANSNSASDYAILQSGQSLTLTFKGVKIDSSPGVGTLSIRQLFNSGEEQGTLEIEKKQLENSLVAWLDPPMIALEGISTLNWTVVGGTKLEVSGFPTASGKKEFTIDGTPPVSGSTLVYIQNGSSSQTYTLELIRPGAGVVARTQLTLTYHSPYISEFVPVEPLPPQLPADRPVTLRYSTLFTTTAELVSPIQANPLPNPENGSYTVRPGEDAFRIGGKTANIPASLAYTLTANGFLGPSRQTQTIPLKQIVVLYFKYMVRGDGGQLEKFSYALDPPTWPGLQITTGVPDLAIFELWGPGGQMVTLYLGSADKAHPQIQYFHADPKGGGAWNLEWVTANLSSLVLNPGNHLISPGAQTAHGKMTFDPLGAQEISLTGTSSSGEKVTSILRLPSLKDESPGGDDPGVPG